jgi:hypothetical protein
MAVSSCSSSGNGGGNGSNGSRSISTRATRSRPDPGASSTVRNCFHGIGCAVAVAYIMMQLQAPSRAPEKTPIHLRSLCDISHGRGTLATKAGNYELAGKNNGHYEKIRALLEAKGVSARAQAVVMDPLTKCSSSPWNQGICLH